MRIARVSLGAAARGMTQREDVATPRAGESGSRPDGQLAAASTCAHPRAPIEPSSSR